MEDKVMFLVMRRWLHLNYLKSSPSNSDLDYLFPGLVTIPVGGRTGRVREFHLCKRQCTLELLRGQKIHFHRHGPALEGSGLWFG